METMTDYQGRPTDCPVGWPEPSHTIYPLEGGSFFAAPSDEGLSLKGILRRCRRAGIPFFFLYEVVDPYYLITRVYRVTVGPTPSTTTRERVEVSSIF